MESTMTKLREIAYSKESSTGMLMAELQKRGHSATRFDGMGGTIIEARLIDGKWHYFVAAELVKKEGQNDPAVKEFKMYAEPGTVDANGEVVG